MICHGQITEWKYNLPGTTMLGCLFHFRLNTFCFCSGNWLCFEAGGWGDKRKTSICLCLLLTKYNCEISYFSMSTLHLLSINHICDSLIFLIFEVFHDGNWVVWLYCLQCTEEAHRPVDCSTVAKWILKNSAESENMNWYDSFLMSLVFAVLTMFRSFTFSLHTSFFFIYWKWSSQWMTLTNVSKNYKKVIFWKYTTKPICQDPTWVYFFLRSNRNIWSNVVRVQCTNPIVKDRPK